MQLRFEPKLLCLLPVSAAIPCRTLEKPLDLGMNSITPFISFAILLAPSL
jgi:hypothetical protein